VSSAFLAATVDSGIVAGALSFPKIEIQATTLGDCDQQGPHLAAAPVSEPSVGTLLLFGVAGATAVAARRRVRASLKGDSDVGALLSTDLEPHLDPSLPASEGPANVADPEQSPRTGLKRWKLNEHEIPLEVVVQCYRTEAKPDDKALQPGAVTA